MAVEIVRQFEFDAMPERIGDVLVDLEGWPQWFALHKGWAGPVPTEVAVGTQCKRRGRCLGVPGDIEWPAAELILPSRFRLSGKGMGRTGAEIEFAVSTAGEASRV